MDFNVALKRIKEVSAEFEEFMLSVNSEIANMIKRDEQLTKAIADKEKASSILEDDYQKRSVNLEETFEKTKANSLAMLIKLRSDTTKEYNEVKAECDEKIKNLTGAVSKLEAQEDVLKDQVAEKEKQLSDLNKSIDAIKAKLG